MIRLPSSHAAVTAPLVASSARFPGIRIGRSLLDGREFRLSPVLAADAVLPSTNSLALGGLGSGKSTTAKTRLYREIREHGHQAVVIDSFGEQAAAGEWRPVVHALGGRVIEAGAFTLNPVSDLFPPPVREQLVRSLILAVEPGALGHQATHALQHALGRPSSTSLDALVDALVAPGDGRWPAAKLAAWGESAAIALSRYTEGSLRGLFDGDGAALPPTDVPVVSFDFSGLDRNSPAIPSLMAAVTCWAEHVWLPQSAAVHRHLVLEEAWQILLSPVTSELIQRQVKNSRKAALSLDVVMHTLSDLGDGKAQDLARLCEIAHVGRLGPEEAALTGALLGLPQWAVDAIPGLDPGQAVWRVGPDYVDIVQTVLTAEESRLTDTSSRRRKAQQAHIPADGPDGDAGPDVPARPGADAAPDAAEPPVVAHEAGEPDRQQDLAREQAGVPGSPASVARAGAGAGSEDAGGRGAGVVPPHVVDHRRRHGAVIRAALEGRYSEAADLAALGEREDITLYGIHSNEAASWLSTRARVAELSGYHDQAVHLRATVTRMGKDDIDWFSLPPEGSTTHTTPERQREPSPAPPPPRPAAPVEPPQQPRRRAWTYIAAPVALAAVVMGALQLAGGEDDQQDREEKAAAYKGRSGAALTIDGVSTDIVARWSTDGDRVVVELRSYFDKDARYLRIDGGGQSATGVRKDGWFPKDPEISVPIDDPLADVTVRIAVGGKTYERGARATSREIRLSPTGVAYDAESGERLPSDL